MAIALVMTGCDRIKRAAGEASERVKETAGEVTEKVGLEVPGHSGFAPEWRTLVDFDGTSYRFRRDLEFPERVLVEEARRIEVSNGRVFDRSALGSSSIPLDGAFEAETSYRGGVDRMDVTVRKSRFILPLLEGAQEGAEAAKLPDLPDEIRILVAGDLEGRTAQLGWNGSRWRMAGNLGSDFRQLNWTDALGDGMPVLQRICGVMPRPMWLGEKRYAFGAVVEVEGEALQMVTGFPARGKMSLEFLRVDDVQGHPCGVFRIKGDLDANAVPRPDGMSEDLEWSVSEGEVWMSLVHPVLLRSDTKAVSTVRRHQSQTGPQTWWQGNTRETVVRKWQPES